MMSGGDFEQDGKKRLYSTKSIRSTVDTNTQKRGNADNTCREGQQGTGGNNQSSKTTNRQVK